MPTPIYSFKHLKKDPELLLGLNFWTILNTLLFTLSLIYLTLSFKLALNSFLFIFLASIFTIAIVTIIKSSQEPEIRGYYSSFILHPFENQFFTLNDNIEGYKSIKSIIDIRYISDQYLISNDNDLICVLELNQGITLNRLDSIDQEILIKNWSNILTVFSEIKNIKSYFFADKNFGDLIQIFIDINQYPLAELKSCDLDNLNYNYYQEQHNQWYSEAYAQSGFIPDPKFYIVIRQKNQRNNIHPILKTLQKGLGSKLSNFNQQFAEDKTLFKEKIKTLIKFFTNYNLELKQLGKNELHKFYDHWLTREPNESEININKEEKFSLIDKSKYLLHPKAVSYPISKTYRLTQAPESGELDFWIYDLIKRSNYRCYINIHTITRNGQKDRLDCEQKALTIKQLCSLNKQSSQVIIRENEIASDKLLRNSSSFDLSIFITVLASTEDELQAIDNFIQQPIRSAKFSGLERQQVINYFYSLPFAFNNLTNQEKIFMDIDLASSCFSFISEQIGSPNGLLLGFNKDNQRPIYLDDYDRKECNNRNFNFIGDSGSGKTVLAKLSILRSYKDPSRYFYIIDSTEDGWKFFIDFLGGQIIEIDKIKLKEGDSLFNPFDYSIAKDYQLNQHLEDLINFLAILKNSDRILTAQEKNFLFISLNKLYKILPKPRLSDLYQIWQDEANTELHKEWLDIIAPYCYISNGIYASLADGSGKNLQDRLILFTFSKLCSDENYIKASIFLLTNFISKKIIFEKQTRTNLVIDEAWKLLSDSKSSHAKDLITHLARAGRGLDLGLWTISQKPSDLPAEIHSNASCSFIFQLKENKDRYDMVRFANLKEKETESINSGLLHNPGLCFMKTTRSSGFIDIKLDPFEAMICNSTRTISNLRNQYFMHFNTVYQNPTKSALATIHKLIQQK